MEFRPILYCVESWRELARSGENWRTYSTVTWRIINRNILPAPVQFTPYILCKNTILIWVIVVAYVSKPWEGQNLSSDFQWKFRVAPPFNLMSHPRIDHTEITSPGSIGGISCCLAVRWYKVSHQTVVSVVIFSRNIPSWQHAGRGCEGRIKRNYDEHDGEGKKDEVKDEQTSQKSNCEHSFPKSGSASKPLASFCDSSCTAATEGKYEGWAGTEEEGVARRKAMTTETTNGVRKPEVEFFWSQPLTSYYNGRLNSSVGGTCRRALNQLSMFPATLK